jgi:signal transduction histidine kinase
VVALLVGAVAYAGIRRATDFGAAARHSAATGEALSTIMLGLDDAETGQRGFLLTGDTSYLAPFRTAEKIIPPALATLSQLSSSGPVDKVASDSLNALVTAKFAELNRTVQLSQSEGQASAIALVLSGRGKLLMDESRRLVAVLSEREAERFRESSEAQEQARALARLVLAFGIATSVLLGLVANARIVREADRLSRTVLERDAANETLQEQAIELEAANEELTRSSLALQEQAVELEQQTEEAQALAEELEVTNDELSKANDELEERSKVAAAAEESARSASKAKSDFLAMMSHEIRTPINAVVGYSELLALGLSGPLTPEQNAQVQRIQQSTSHLLQLVNEVLDLAKIESGTLRVDAGLGQVGETIDAAIDLVRTQAQSKQISINDRCDGARAISYRGDQDRVRQIILNLLSNAVKFTPNGGAVTIDASVTRWPESSGKHTLDESCVAIIVSDTGIGIAAEQFGRIFEPFTQIETDGRNPYTREQSGTGLGLPISQQLAGLMGGSLSVESSVGEGSRFTLWLPTTIHVAESFGADAQGSKTTQI